jgi:WD40 repeat protein
MNLLSLPLETFFEICSFLFVGEFGKFDNALSSRGFRNNWIQIKEKVLVNIFNIHFLLERKLVEHFDRVVCLLQLRDGRLVSGSYDNTIVIWNIDTGDSESLLSGHTNRVKCLLQSPDGRLLSSGWDGMVKVWDITSERCEITLHHGGMVLSLELLSAGRIASAGESGIVCLWNIEAGRTIGELRGHNRAVNCMSYLPDDRLVSGSDDASIMVWDVATWTASNSSDNSQMVVSYQEVKIEAARCGISIQVGAYGQWRAQRSAGGVWCCSRMVGSLRGATVKPSKSGTSTTIAAVIKVSSTAGWCGV